MAQFDNAKLTGITVNLKDGQIHISLTVPDVPAARANMETFRRSLDPKAAPVFLEITPRQLSLPSLPTGKKPEGKP